MLPVPVSTLTARQQAALPRAIIVDLDGTLCLRGDRHPHDETRVGHDTVNVPVLTAVQGFHIIGHLILFTSGRHEGCRADTEMWLLRHLMHPSGQHIPYEKLLMRADGDNRNDALVKFEMYQEHIFDKYTVTAVLDDRNRVVDMWRGLGLTCMQVAPGDF